jgi:hypothetical protein
MATKPKKPAAAPAPGMVSIEEKAHAYADALALRGKLVTTLRDHLKVVTDEALPDLRKLSAEVAVLHDQLKELLDKNKALFESPRSAAFHGIKLGFAKGKGKVVIDNPDATIKAIEKKLPEQLDTLAPSTRKLSLTALALLDVKTLKSIGGHVSEATDEAFIKCPDDDTTKFVEQLTAAYTTTPTTASSATTTTNQE